MSEIFGAKWIISVSLIGSAVINLATPYLASSVFLLVTARVILGALQGGLFPSSFQMASKWLPLKERSTAMGLIGVAGASGSIIGSSLTGYLSDNGFLGIAGWPSAFYVS